MVIEELDGADRVFMQYATREMNKRLARHAEHVLQACQLNWQTACQLIAVCRSVYGGLGTTSALPDSILPSP
jgi:hypothetical protein